MNKSHEQSTTKEKKESPQLSEERIREIAREEILKREMEIKAETERRNQEPYSREFVSPFRENL